MQSINDFKTAISFITIKGDIRHTNSYAMDHIPKGFSRWSAATHYISDIERIVSELKTSVSFIEKTPPDNFLQSHTLNLEDYIMYHQGYFLDLTHQLKDKLCLLLYTVIVGNSDYSRKEEKSKKLLRKLLNNEKIKNISGLIDLLNIWNSDQPTDDTTNPITSTLKKRTDYHHYRNPLTSDTDYFRAKNHRNILALGNDIYFNEKGKLLIEEKGKQSVEAWQKKTYTSVSNTVIEIEKNIDSILNIIISCYNLPGPKSTEGKKAAFQFMPLLESTVVKKSTRVVEDMDAFFKETSRMVCNHLKEFLNEDFVSLYAVGSITRKAYQHNLSDINFVVVIKSKDSSFRNEIKHILEAPGKDLGQRPDFNVLDIEDFLGPENEKLRFICQTDGILIEGQNLLVNEKERSKSFKLVWLLNKDFKQKLLDTIERVENIEDPGPSTEYAEITRNISKRAYYLMFGQVVGNNTVYTADFKEMKELVYHYSPSNSQVMRRTYSLIGRRLMIDKEALMSVLSYYKDNLIPLYSEIEKAMGNTGKHIS